MRLSIRRRLTIVFIGLAVLPLLFIGAVLGGQSVRVQSAQAIEFEQQVAARVIVEIELFVSGLERDLSNVMVVNDLLNASPEEQAAALLRLLALQDAFEELILLDAQGTERIRISRLDLIVSEDLVSRANEPEFSEPVATRATYYSPVWFDPLNGEPLLTMALPFIDLRSGEVTAVLVADTRLKKVWELISTIPVGAGESIYLVDSQSAVIAHRDPSIVLRNTHFVLPPTAGIFPGLESPRAYLAVEELRFGEQVLYVVAERSVSEALALARDTVWITAVMVAVAFLLATTLGLLIVRQISQPIQELAVTAKNIKAGDLSGRVKIPAQEDEVKDLAEAFNSMAIQLQQTLSGLEAQNQKLREAEARLTAYAAELERSNKALQSFAYVASHDLQEPLRKIQAFSDRLQHSQAQQLDSRGVDYLQRMQKAAERMQILIHDLLMFSRVTTHKNCTKVDLQEVVKTVVADLELRIEENQGILDIGPLPTIEADATQMRQLFQNLLSNALKFRTEQPPVITVSSRPVQAEVSNNSYWEIFVADNGIGFDEKYLDRIFTIFQRLHGRAGYEGTGIGLAICQKIVEEHAGQITAHSVAGEGATFIVTLPEKQNQSEVKRPEAG